MNMAVRTEALDASTSIRYFPGECEQRPWGSWEVLATGSRYTLKRIVVNPGHRLSLQYHNFRSELWTIVAGHAEVEIDDATRRLSRGQQIHVPMRARHRLRNVGREPLVVVEVQMGEILDESDIVRLVDDYGRHALPM